MSQWESDPRRMFATEVVTRLTEAGFIAYFAGGCVRDELLGLRAKDYDVATNAVPAQVRKIFGRRRTLAIGAAFGVVAVLGRKKQNEGMVEVATFRTDGDYLDGRHPSAVSYSTPQHDAERRDFTINGMFFDPLKRKVIDFVEGEIDLRRQLIRAIGDPQRRFDEDHLRLLRAVRFATTLGFQVEPKTWEAVRRGADKIHTVSGERIAVEFEKIFASKAGSRGIEQLDLSGLLPHLIPQMYAEDDRAVAEKIGAAVRMLSVAGRSSLALGLSCLLAAAVPRSRQAEAVTQLARRLKLSNQVRDAIAFSLRGYRDLLKADSLPWSHVQPLLVHSHAETAFRLAECWAAAERESEEGVILCGERLQWDRQRLDPRPLIDGAGLQALGLKPGPEFKEILSRVRGLQLDGELMTGEDARRWIRTTYRI